MNDILGECSRKRRYSHGDTDSSSFDQENCHIPNFKRIKLERFDDQEPQEIFHTQDVSTNYNYLSESDVKQENIYNDNNRTESSDIDEGIQSYCSETHINKSSDIQSDIRDWGLNCGVSNEDINKLISILEDKQVFCNNKSINESEVTSESSTSSQFEKKILEEIKNLKNYQEESFNKLLNKINNKHIEIDSEDGIRRNWFGEYNVFLPISTAETFDNFCKLLNEVKEFEQKFMTFVEVIAQPNKRHTLPQKIGAILKKLITRDVVIQFWVVRSKEGKVTLSNTKFYDCLLDYFSPQLKANKEKSTEIKTEFNSALRCAIANAKDWGNNRAKNRQSQ